jgi:hypothetical protein
MRTSNPSIGEAGFDIENARRAQPIPLCRAQRTAVP